MHLLIPTALPLFALLQVALASPVAEAANVNNILEARQLECYAYSGECVKAANVCYSSDIGRSLPCTPNPCTADGNGCTVFVGACGPATGTAACG